MMMKRIYAALAITLSLFLPQQLFSQLEASNWYFGFGAGIQFDQTTGNVTALTDGQLNTNEGCTAISDDQGNLLFYTDGSTVYNRNHVVMQNGNGLKGNSSSSQSAVIIPKPQDDNIYYIFTVDAPNGAGPGAQDSGLHYYEVDMSLDSGLGAVTSSIAQPNNLIATTSEKIVAINHETRDEILVTVYANANGFTSNAYNTFYTFTISASGVDPNPVVSANFGNRTISDPRGYLKISANGRFLVSCNMGDGTFLYDYDRTTGIVSNERRLVLTGSAANQGYGAEFSPDGRLLYVSAVRAGTAGDPLSQQTAALYQFDLSDNTAISQDNIRNSIIVDQTNTYRGAMQLGIDGRIYRSLSENFDTGYPFLGVINNPNARGTACNYVHDAIPLSGKLSTQGLPPFIQSFFAAIDVENLCLGNATTFSFEADTLPDSILWEFGDGTGTSTIENPSYTYSSPGQYEVKLTLNTAGATRIYRTNIEIYNVPVAAQISDIEVCDLDLSGDETIDLDAEVGQLVRGSQNTQEFEIRYYNNINDAQNNENELSSSLDITTGMVTVVAKIFNINNQDCFDTASVDITLYAQPVANPLENLEECDDDFDGFVNFDLTQQNSDLLGTAQNAADFVITYHRTQADAQSGDDPITNASNYRNEDPFSQTIYARIENRLTDQCADVSEPFELIVNPKPVALDFAAFQCDEDGIADRRTIFSLQSFDESISDNAMGVQVSYYATRNQAQTGDFQNALNPVSYRNTAPSQVIFARVENESTRCFSVSEVTLDVSASDAQDTTLELCDDDGTEDGFTEFDLFTANDVVLLNAPSDVTVNYYETLEGAQTEQNPLPRFYTNTTAGRQLIYARAESEDGNCFGFGEVTLIVNELPQIETYEFIRNCGTPEPPITIDAGLPAGAIETDFTYLWSTGETTQAIEIDASGTYEVIVTNENNCTKIREVEVILSEVATIEGISVSNAVSGGRSGNVAISVSGRGDYVFSIEDGFGFQENPVFNDLRAGFYDVVVLDRLGCGEATTRFAVLGYPRFFTPNDDGFNDFWNLKGTDGMLEPEAEVFIFDRYGKLLTRVTPSGPGWDGTFNGQPLPSSDYWFRATLTDGSEFSGHFSLKR
ncbi:hypothetical protein BST97_05090 [Nonlabens spongiae]|uniref:PKD domain-containing protein n=1 Tax=Nonlabens spongiae TaxID=331648 RepID=A0A1W6MIK9_9FLAO|nr:T9SS type B sorting domain-containing protein [Nonlabens spongiae]ARN77407.1 hypothetical protein BST97_05090 [Nonlabens spongiae]